MKRISKYILLFSLLGGLITSCSKESKTETALNRSSLTGTWMVTESSKKATYEVTILIDSANSNGVLIANFAGAGQNVKAVAFLTGNTLSLTNNELLSNEWIVNGSGMVTGTTRIDWSYSIDDGANLTSVKAVFMKK
jgi:hypothetical protein